MGYRRKRERRWRMRRERRRRRRRRRGLLTCVGIPYFSRERRGWAEHQPGCKVLIGNFPSNL